MRYKPEHKQETHRRIVKTASQEFRTHGFEGVGIARLMGDLNLTHGGFYAHFADKEELVAEASVLALNESLETMLAMLAKGGVPALLDFYLSEAHRDEWAEGCPLPALTAEVARRSPAMREAFTKKLSEVLDAIAVSMPGPTLAAKRDGAYGMFAAMSGAIALARAVSDAKLSKAILESTREQILNVIHSEST